MQRLRERTFSRVGLTRSAALLLIVIAGWYVFGLFQGPSPLAPPTSDVSSSTVAGTWSTEGFDAAHSRFVDGPAPDLAGTVRWTFQADSRIFAEPTVADGVVYVSTDDGSVLALDERSGDQLWRVDGFGPLLSSPVIAGGRLYVGTRSARLLALDRADGSTEWEAPLDGAVFSSPTVIDGEVFVGTLGHSVFCFDAATGELRWRGDVPGWVTDPVSVSGDVVAVSSDDDLVFFDRATGARRWAFDSDRAIDSPPVLAGGLAVATQVGLTRVMFAVEPDATPWRFARQVRDIWWQFWVWSLAPSPPGVPGLAWVYVSRGDTFAGPLAVTDDALIGLSRRGKLEAIDRNTQELRWSRAFADGIGGPVAYGDHIYVSTNDGVFAVDARTGEDLWHAGLAGLPTIGPVVSGTALYVADQSGTLYAIE